MISKIPRTRPFSAMKACIKCSVVKPLDEYYAHKKMADQRLGICKDCHRAAVRVLYFEKMKDPEWRERELGRQREKSARSRRAGESSTTEIIRRSKMAWAERNLEKRKAHTMAGNAIRDGRLIRKPCEVCGKTKVDAHHDDYSKPLEVRWLCRRHHADVHLEINRRKRAEKYANQQPRPSETR